MILQSEPMCSGEDVQLENKNTVPLKNNIDAANKDINFVFKDTFA